MTEIEEKDYKYLIALAITALGFFAFLVYIKSKEHSSIQPLYQTQPMSSLSSESDNEIHQILQNQQNQQSLLQNHQSQIDRIINNSFNQTHPKISELETELQNLRNQLKTAQEHLISQNQLKQTPNKPSVQKLNDNTENKIRQLKFRML